MSATVFFSSANELATLTNTFKVGGVPTDPTAISLTVTDPNGTATTYTYAAAQVTRTSAGVYTKDITCNLAGTWTYQWDGTGTASDTTVGTWEVFETQLGRLYATVDALKSRLGIGNTDDELELHAACFAVSRWVEQHCRRHFWRTTSSEVRTFEPDGLYSLKLGPFNDLVSVTTLRTDSSGDGSFETTWAASDYQLLPANPAAAPERLPYTEVKAIGAQSFPTAWASYMSRADRVEITGVFGWPAVPMGVKQAALILAEDTYKLKDAPFGVAGEGEFTIRVGDNRRALTFLRPYIAGPGPVLVG